MKYTLFCFLFFIGVINCLHAQDRIVARNGRTYDVKIDRIDEENVRYTYPPDVRIYLQPKTAISYIQYADGRREFFDGSQRTTDSGTANRATTSGVTSSSGNNRLLIDDDEFYWQDVKTTFAESDVRGMTRLNRVSANSSVSYRDAIQQLKKKAAALGGTTILVMEVPENEDIEIIGVVYRDEKTVEVQRNANQRSTVPVESSSDARRRRIAQQTDRYNDESNLDFDDYSQNSRSSNASSRSNEPPARSGTQPSRNDNTQSRQAMNDEEPDAIYLQNGRVIKGVIEEYDPDDFVSIRVANGRTYEYSMDEVRRVSQTSLNNSRRSSTQARNANTSSRGNSRYDDDRYGNNSRSASSRNNAYYSESGYKGIFDVGYNFALGNTGEKNNIEINTSHGYQLNEFLFAGAGLGLHLYSARDPEMKVMDTYPHYVSSYRTDSTAYLHAIDSSYMTLPIFLDVRGYLPLQNGKLAPFVMIRFGYSFNLSDGFSGMGIYMNPAVGLKIKFSPMLGAHVSLGYAYQNYGGIPKEGGYGYYYIKDSSNQKYEAKGAGGFSLKLGIEF